MAKVAHLNVPAKMALNVSRKPDSAYAKKVIIFMFCMKFIGVYLCGGGGDDKISRKFFKWLAVIDVTILSVKLLVPYKNSPTTFTYVIVTA